MKNTDVTTIVSGLPRSGTSMMMKMLEAGGMEVVQDGVRSANKDNPGGYYEFEKVKQIKEDSSFLDAAKGKAVKILFNFLYDLPADRQYKIIFMRRKMSEILASQTKMLERRGEKNDISDEEMAMIFEMQIKKIKAWLVEQSNMEVVYVYYHDLLENPEAHLRKVNNLLEDTLDIEHAIRVADKSLYRNRKG